jgi:hypothetical protein
MWGWDVDGTVSESYPLSDFNVRGDGRPDSVATALFSPQFF